VTQTAVLVFALPASGADLAAFTDIGAQA